MSTELYKVHRPKSFKSVVGQDAAVRTLQTLLKKGKLPHTILLTGPSGCGKTTIARILRSKLNCNEHDYLEIDCADTNGIDMVRDIKQRVERLPLGGKDSAKLFLLDECHQLTSQAQESLLKTLEDTPSYAYFILGTTIPNKLKETIKTRCTEIKLVSISDADLMSIVKAVCKKEEKTLSDAVIRKVAESARGSARQCLVWLHQIINLPDEESQLAALSLPDAEATAIDIARKLMDNKSTWDDVAKLLKAAEQDPETIRRCILGYASASLLNMSGAGVEKGARAKRAALLLESFEEHLFNSGKPGLVLQAFNCYSFRMK